MCLEEEARSIFEGEIPSPDYMLTGEGMAYCYSNTFSRGPKFSLTIAEGPNFVNMKFTNHSSARRRGQLMKHSLNNVHSIPIFCKTNHNFYNYFPGLFFTLFVKARVYNKKRRVSNSQCY